MPTSTVMIVDDNSQGLLDKEKIVAKHLPKCNAVLVESSVEALDSAESNLFDGIVINVTCYIVGYHYMACFSLTRREYLCGIYLCINSHTSLLIKHCSLTLTAHCLLLPLVFLTSCWIYYMHCDSNEGTYYQLLSERSKRRLDTLRQLAIERLLVNYSMVSIYGMDVGASWTSIFT